ncbi:MAG: N-6 DNA methylase [Acidobacteriota bacterium]|nr:N-6 DNA methylase [Acidobacteriota bacterium]
MTVAGVTGDLISSEHLARLVDEYPPPAPGDQAWLRALVRWWPHAAPTLGPASAPRAVFDVVSRPLVEHLGYSVARVQPQPWGHVAVLESAGRPVASLLSTEWGMWPASAWTQAVRSSLVTRLPWALVVNGRSLIIVDATRPWTRRLLTFDLHVVLRDARAATALGLLARAEALGVEGASALAAHVAASDIAGASVCSALGDGVLEALEEFVVAFDRVPGRRPTAPDHTARVLEQSLTIVYRLLFLFFAEARQLVPVWHRVYRDAYSVDALCRRVMAQPGTPGVWAAVQAIARLAHAGCRAADLTVTAFNGRLFAPGRTPLGERRGVSDRSAGRALLAIGTTPARQGRRPIAFHDLGVEQLGAVYERVLELEPVRCGPHLRLRPTSTERKTSGSFYTPRSITDFLVRRTLGPLVEGRSSRGILGIRVIDPAMGSGAFLVSACRFLTERVEMALVEEGTWLESDTPREARGDLARTVAERCLFGVDLNPTAVQLARLSLWLTTLATGRPLTFLDHHLAAGNSLVGARLTDLRRPPSRIGHGREPDAAQVGLFEDAALEALARQVVPERLRLSLDPSTTVSDVREKERRLDRLLAVDGASARWQKAADLWCGLVLDRSTGTTAAMYQELQRHVAGLPTSVPARQLAGPAQHALDAARAHGAFHWELAFPEVFVDEDGTPRPEAGFDAVVGNPPWEMMRADTGAAGRRNDARDALRTRLAFVRDSGHYPLATRGQVNQYQLFVARCLQVLRPGGRFGLILPSGLQTDVGSADLRRTLLDTCHLDTWLAFQNRRAIFPIHRGLRFLLVAGTTGGQTDALAVRDGLTDVDALAALPDNPRAETEPSRIWLTREFLSRWDPVHLTVPTLATPLDASIAWRALQLPPLASPEGWAVRFGRELNATEDRASFVDYAWRQRAGRPARIPVIDGRHLRPFGVDLGSVTRGIRVEDAARRLDAASSFGRPRPCYRDVASATNRLTLIAALLPAGVVSTHTVFCARQALSDQDAWCLVGVLNSLAANYLVRLQMSTHVTSVLMARLPVPRPAAGSVEARAIAELSKALSSRRDVEDDALGYARLNALVSRLYGLTAAEHAYIVSTFPLLSRELRDVCIEAFG